MNIVETNHRLELQTNDGYGLSGIWSHAWSISMSQDFRAHYDIHLDIANPGQDREAGLAFAIGQGDFTQPIDEGFEEGLVFKLVRIGSTYYTGWDAVLDGVTIDNEEAVATVTSGRI